MVEKLQPLSCRADRDKAVARFHPWIWPAGYPLSHYISDLQIHHAGFGACHLCWPGLFQARCILASILAVFLNLFLVLCFWGTNWDALFTFKMDS